MSAGKGDAPRPVNGDKFRSNYENIFKNKKPNEKTKPEPLGGPRAIPRREVDGSIG